MPPKAKAFLYDIVQACDAVRSFLSGRTFTDYQQDELLRAAVERKLMIIGEAVYQILRIAPELESSISQARQIVGFRNVLVHGYFAVEDETVWGIASHDIPVLAQEAARLLRENE
ncbi:MAG TPA: DUF86 domain-containing protein [Anaerohalosphaeraceae bacterium]|nr:DUF86 domain-containing protein [Anaerohalosphaeraceae bacterium]HOL89508.1 DUF86 domain-containing protein [Anaerohalosphaeraceae bacterium]HPP57102.1 DUF86 domain-containing protein [Anaerohalosphaeraceae bacterium]